jgi:hypothetical protein
MLTEVAPAQNDCLAKSKGGAAECSLMKCRMMKIPYLKRVKIFLNLYFDSEIMAFWLIIKLRFFSMTTTNYLSHYSIVLT